ncbi:unnamed protein product [Merluccius merluccius]
MRSLLFSTLAALLCALTARADVTPMKDFDLTQASMKMGIAMMVPTEESDLDLSYANLNADGSCYRMTHLAKKTETPGHFTFHSEAWNNDNDMRFVDVQYSEYALIHNVKTTGDVSEAEVNLYSRTPEVSAVVQQSFQQLSLDSGVLPENVAILAKSGASKPDPAHFCCSWSKMPFQHGALCLERRTAP